MLKLKLLIFCLVFILNAKIYSQDKKNASLPSNNKKREYSAQTVIVKVKPEIKKEFASKKNNHLLIKKIATQIGVVSIEKLFPNESEPEHSHNRMKMPLVDLTRTYIIKYSSNHSVEEVISMFSKTGIFEYAEPQYEDKILTIPNDPLAAPSAAQGFYLENMKYYDALDIEDGDTNVVIGIIDTGVKWDHEDLTKSIKYNYADPINGIDDDADGYKDNFRGWDLGMNDNDPAAIGNGHGTVVAGCAGATTNNGLGIAGIGGKCKILPIKAATDNPASSILMGYQGILYAANHGCKIANVSWGGPGGFSQTSQDLINFAAINKDIVIIAAAGNDASGNPFYPASYENVLSVAGLDTIPNIGLDSTIEIPADFATHNYYVDIGAMGRKVRSTTNDGSYANNSGSSFACPLVSGAAGLVRSKYPLLNALQVAELLRVTADPLIDTVAQNILFKQEQLGKGRLNIYRALTDNTTPAVRMYKKHAFNKFGDFAASGDTTKLVCYFRNFLQNTSNATVTLSSLSPYVTVTQNSFNIGSIGTLDSIKNDNSPFKLVISSNSPLDYIVTLRLGIDDPGKNYKDYQYFEIVINPSLLDIDTNMVTMTVTNNGRFGFKDATSSLGDGLIYKNQSLLFEGGLLVGTSATKVSDCIRGNPAGTGDLDFSYTDFAKYVNLPEGDQGIRLKLTDNPTGIGLNIEQRTYAFHDSPNEKYIITEYLIENTSGSTLDSLCVGIFSDWDIQNSALNKSDWDTEDSIGYTYAVGANGIYAGVCLLTDNSPSCFSMDHASIGGNNINPNDGFTKAEKFSTLSGGIARPQAGQTSGYDVSQVVAGTLRNIAANEKRTIAFAHVVGDDLNDLKASARQAKNLFRINNTSLLPVVTNYHFCKGDTLDVTVTPTNEGKFNFYSLPTDITPVHTGSNYTITDINKNDSLYVRSIDSLYPSALAMSKIIFHADVKADFNFTPSVVDLAIADHADFTSSSLNASQLDWKISDGNSYNTSTFTHHFQNAGTYSITLKAKGDYNCIDSATKTIQVIGALPTGNTSALNERISISPNPSNGNIQVEFMLDAPGNIDMIIYNTLGEEIKKIVDNNVLNKKYDLNISEGKGIYFARFYINNKLAVKKIVIE